MDVLLLVDDLGEARIKARGISSKIFADTGIPATVIAVSLNDYLAGRTSLIRREKSQERRVDNLERVDEAKTLMIKAEAKLRSAKLLLEAGEIEDAASRGLLCCL